MGGGGPDFFFSVSLAATFKMAVPSEADLKGILAALQQVLLPEFQKPSLPSAAEWKIAPLPLPEPVLTERKSARVLNICTFVGVLVICLGVFSWIFFAGGMAWVLILLVARAATDGGHYRAEKIRRQAYHKNARQAFLQAEEAWKTESQNGRIGIESAAAEGRQAYAGFSALDAKMNQEIQKLHSGRRESQLNHFLRTFLLADHRIEQMGPARLAILASYGVETAADINVGRIAQIPGFGEARVDTLLRWRGGCESKFRYDPAKAVPQSEVMSIQVKYAREKQRIAALMRYKLNEVQRRAATCQRNVREREAQLLRAWHAFVQADQNFKVL
jgi:DNA-binding helix-hairpin-helix protein with protein kinase domain